MTSDINEYTLYIKGVLSKKRFNHSLAVAEMCVKLAQIHDEDEERAYTAGLLHDIRKEADKEVLLEEVLRCDMIVTEIEKSTHQLWHAIAGAHFCKNELRIEDEGIIRAIRFHTIGKANMTKLEKILYLADVVSVDRTYEDVEKYRRLAFEDLDNGMFHTILYSINKTLSKLGLIPRFTFEAYNYYNIFKK